MRAQFLGFAKPRITKSALLAQAISLVVRIFSAIVTRIFTLGVLNKS